MKLLETLTEQERTDILLGNEHGIFKEMILSTDPYYKYITDISRGYYFGRSGSKSISPMYERILEMNQDPNILGQVIFSKFHDKWVRLYSTLIDNDYKVFYNKEETETTNYGKSIAKTGENVDTRTQTTKEDSLTKTNSKETTITTGENTEDTYGFNSVSAVGDNVSNENTTETREGLADDNTETYTNNQTNNESVSHSISTTDQHSGSDHVERYGRDVAGADLIEAEVRVRMENVFFDIIYKDVDSIVTLEIYER